MSESAEMVDHVVSWMKAVKGKADVVQNLLVLVATRVATDPGISKANREVISDWLVQCSVALSQVEVQPGQQDGIMVLAGKSREMLESLSRRLAAEQNLHLGIEAQVRQQLARRRNDPAHKRGSFYRRPQAQAKRQDIHEVRPMRPANSQAGR
jgi:hypothetical protein